MPVNQRAKGFQKGVDVRRKIFGAEMEKAASVSPSAQMFPEMWQLSNEVMFGRVWGRSRELSLKNRSLIVVTTQIALGKTDELRSHLLGALHLGWTKEQVLEVILHMAYYAGWPAAVGALRASKTVFDEKGLTQPVKPYVKGKRKRAADVLYQRGIAMRERLSGVPSSGNKSTIEEVHPDMWRLTMEVVFGQVWPRRRLPVQSCCLVTVSCLVTLGRWDELRIHMRNALNVGWTKQQVREVILQCAFYAGWPAARHSLTVAKEVFAQVL